MNKEHLESNQIATLLHTVFDEQIINYGAYNLVLATGSAIYQNPDVAQHQSADQELFLVGYREMPREMVITPIQTPEITSGGAPTSIDNTTIASMSTVDATQLKISLTNGSVFDLSFIPVHAFKSDHGQGQLDQSFDLDDFYNFINNSHLLEEVA